MDQVTAELNKFGKYVRQQARTRLTQNKPHQKKDTGTLYNDMTWDVEEQKNGAILTFEFGGAEEYWYFVDQGVKGTKSQLKAPMSQFRFGSGSGGTGGLTRGIEGWVKRKRIQFQVRSAGKKKGQWMSYEQTSFLIIRSIWNTGLQTTEFITVPFERAFLRLPDAIYAAYGLEVEEKLKVILS